MTLRKAISFARSRAARLTSVPNYPEFRHALRQPPAMIQRFLYETAWGCAAGEFSEYGLLSFQLPRPGENFAHGEADLPAAWRAALDRYFAGEPEDFSAIPLDFGAASPFNCEVWQAARQTPWGATTTYGQLAARMGRPPGHARAVGHALGANLFHVLVPCHRFIAANGDLVNYAAGLDWKRRLLQREGSLFL